MIVQVSIALKKIVVSDRLLDNMRGSHCQNSIDQLKSKKIVDTIFYTPFDE